MNAQQRRAQLRAKPVYAPPAEHEAGDEDLDARGDLLADPAWYERERERWLKRPVGQSRVVRA